MAARMIDKLRFLLVFFVFLVGCGASFTAREQHRILNAITDVADPSYAAAVVACDAAEGFVNAREDTREQEDADVAAIHADCNRVFAAFEALRQLQLTAREAVDMADQGAISRESADAALQGLVNAYHQIREVLKPGWTPGGIRH